MKHRRQRDGALARAQDSLNEARDRYAELYDLAPVGYLLLDRQGRITQINLTAANLLGRPRDSLIDVGLTSLIPDDQRGALREFLARSQQAVDSKPLELEMPIEVSGVCLRMIARPVTDRPGSSRLFAAMLDVTEQRRLERERQQIYEAERKKAAELAREVAERLAAEARVKALLDRLIDVQERERRRLALNLHDQLGQELTALRLTMDALKAVDPASPEGRARFETMEKIVAQLDRDVDFLAWELRPAALDDVGLEAALREFIRQWSWTQGITVELHATEGQWPRLASDVESHLYRIVQEALNNVSKHAGATHVSVLLERRGDEVALIVEDDGRGFDVEAARRGPRGTAMGVAGMQERAASIGGRLDYESAPGRGTTLFVRIPIKVAVRPK